MISSYPNYQATVTFPHFISKLGKYNIEPGQVYHIEEELVISSVEGLRLGYTK
jgi:hypothetical protein